MNLVRNMVVSLLVIGLAVSTASAKEYLRVLYVFDDLTTNYNQSQINSISTTLNYRLNKTFQNSGLSNKFYFKKIKAINISISGNNESLGDIAYRYRRYKNSNMTLRHLQRLYKADIVVTYMNPRKTSYCGMAVDIPNSRSEFSSSDFSYVFLSNESRCNSNRLIAHEVGHIFGIHHGQYGGDYVNGIPNGYGVNVNWSLDYGTIMSKASISANRFSNPNVYKYGVFDKTNVCGNSRSNAYQFIKNNAKYYNKRGGWFFTLVKKIYRELDKNLTLFLCIFLYII